MRDNEPLSIPITESPSSNPPIPDPKVDRHGRVKPNSLPLFPFVVAPLVPAPVVLSPIVLILFVAASFVVPPFVVTPLVVAQLITGPLLRA